VTARELVWRRQPCRSSSCGSAAAEDGENGRGEELSVTYRKQLMVEENTNFAHGERKAETRYHENTLALQRKAERKKLQRQGNLLLENWPG